MSARATRSKAPPESSRRLRRAAAVEPSESPGLVSLRTAVLAELDRFDEEGGLCIATGRLALIDWVIGDDASEELADAEQQLLIVRREVAHAVRFLKETTGDDGAASERRECADERLEDALEAIAKAEDAIHYVRGDIDRMSERTRHVVAKDAPGRVKPGGPRG